MRSCLWPAADLGKSLNRQAERGMSRAGSWTGSDQAEMRLDGDAQGCFATHHPKRARWRSELPDDGLGLAKGEEAALGAPESKWVPVAVMPVVTLSPTAQP